MSEETKGGRAGKQNALFSCYLENRNKAAGANNTFIEGRNGGGGDVSWRGFADKLGVFAPNSLWLPTAVWSNAKVWGSGRKQREPSPHCGPT